MKCRNCAAEELHFEIRAESGPLLMMEQVIEHLRRGNTWFQQKESSIVVKEAGALNFLDFYKDHMSGINAYFRIGEQAWQPIEHIAEVVEAQWIDDVIAQERVICYYQPIVDASRHIYAYEMLARFPREDGSLMYPNEVFAAAKKRGRLYALDRLCRITAVKYAAMLNKKAFINFIPTSIYSPQACLKSTVDAAKRLRIDPYQLVFEVVETEQVDDLEHLKSILAYYQAKGFHYALYDVGEGYSTLDMLAEIRPHYMKLDRKWGQGVAANSQKQSIAKRFLETALNVGSIPLAEGIESEADFAWLKQQGYQLFQGYLFGKPAPVPQR
jgi:EAL domain-containing protein (putative c-di-GMP-specific phosphodiesterase class I)